jgi:hypothetical protein
VLFWPPVKVLAPAQGIKQRSASSQRFQRLYTFVGVVTVLKQTY